MKPSTILPFLTLTTTALADGQAIVASLAAVDASTARLGRAVSGWDGGVAGTVPIAAGSAAVLATVRRGTRTAREASGPLDLDETLAVASAAGALAATVNATLAALVDAKPRFDRRRLSPLVYLTLGVQRRASAGLSGAVVEKVRAELRALAGDLVAPIDESFGLALEVYRPLG